MANDYEAVLCDLFGTLVDDRGHAIPGALELVRALPAQRWAIVTSCGARLAARLVAHAGLPSPPVIVTADDVEQTKPSPACYLKAAERLNVEPVRCLVLEDSLHGVQAADAAGMDCIRVGGGRSIASLRVHENQDGTIALR